MWRLLVILLVIQLYTRIDIFKFSLHSAYIFNLAWDFNLNFGTVSRGSVETFLHWYASIFKLLGFHKSRLHINTYYYSQTSWMISTENLNRGNPLINGVSRWRDDLVNEYAWKYFFSCEFYNILSLQVFYEPPQDDSFSLIKSNYQVYLTSTEVAAVRLYQKENILEMFLDSFSVLSQIGFNSFSIADSMSQKRFWSEAAIRGVLCKNVFLEISQNS